MDDEGLTIIDCQPNVHEYLQDHIPGARYACEGVFMVHGKTLPTEWIIPTVAEVILQNLGLDPNSPVVVYWKIGPLTTCGAFIGTTPTHYCCIQPCTERPSKILCP